MRTSKSVLCLLLIVGVCGRLFGAEERPNIVLILCDDLGYADVGFNGSPDIKTPRLDALASGGVTFKSAYVAHPFCGPSRMSLMTGRYPHAMGTPFNLPNSGHGIEAYNRLGVPVSEKLISSVLQDAGYYTGAIGKWHMGITRPYHPNTRGFDDYYGFLGGGHRYFPEQFKPAYAAEVAKGTKHINEYLLPLERNGVAVDETDYITDALSREAARFVREAHGKEKPFFLYLAYNAPHSPLEAKDEDLALYAHIKDRKRRIFAAMVHAVDRGVGELVDALEETNTLENTLIVFLSDNGGKLELGANNGPLREGKGSAFEGGFRVPMFFHWPKGLPRGRTFEYPVTSLDFYPTFAALGHASVPPEKQLDGRNIIPGVVANRDTRSGEMIYVLRHRKAYHDVGGRIDDWKVSRVGQSAWRLFNLAEDIGEHVDLSAQHPRRVARMVKQLERWTHTYAEPQWFHIWAEGEEWRADGMPRYDETFLEP
ncbi:MAG: hypothetical protein SynsKO_30550 [Synoicihabitans sp.]